MTRTPAARIALPILGLAALAILAHGCDEASPAGPGEPTLYTLTVEITGIGEGRVLSSPAGIDCETGDGSCTAQFEDGTAVTLTATPAEGSVLVEWTGAGSGTTTRQVTTDADRAVTAEFDRPTLAVTEIGTAGGSATSRDGHLTLAVPAGALAATQAISIELVPTSEIGTEFDDAVEALGVAHLYRLGPAGLEFAEPVTLRLAVDGHLVATEAGMELSVPLMAVSNGEAVQAVENLRLEVDADSATAWLAGDISHFSWLYASDNGLGEVSIGAVPDALPVGATFEVEVAWSTFLGGAFAPGAAHYWSGTTSPVRSAEDPVPAGAEVRWYTIDPVARFAYTCEDRGPGAYHPTVRFTYDPGFAEGLIPLGSRDSEVTVRKTVNCIGARLTVTKSGDGTGTVTSSPQGLPAGIDCGEICESAFPLGQGVSLTPTPDPDSEFVRWSGDCLVSGLEGEADVGVVLMDQDATCDAEFAKLPPIIHLLDLVILGEGTGTVAASVGDNPVTWTQGDETQDECVKEGGQPVECRATVERPYGTNVLVSFTGVPTGLSQTGVVTGVEPTGTQGAWSLTLSGDSSDSLAIRFNFRPPGPPLEPRSYPALHLLNLEAARRFASNWSSSGLSALSTTPARAFEADECPPLLLAGQNGALVMDPCTGETVRQYTFSNEPRTFFDAIALPRPEGHDGTQHTLVYSGIRFRFCALDNDGNRSNTCLAVGGSPVYTDANELGGDPSNGAVLVNNTTRRLDFLLFNPDAGTQHGGPFEGHIGLVQSAALPPNVQSVATNAAGDRILAIGSDPGEPGELWYIDRTGGTPESQVIGELQGTNPRRIRCDLEAGICAASDFAGSLINIILWDGEGAPTIAGATEPGALADGPVGLDIFGHRIVSAGFNDDHFSIVTVDAAGAVTGVTTTALPEGCQQPGHALFLRDALNTIVATCWGSGALAVVPDTF